MTVTLRPMTEAEYDDFLRLSVVTFAAEAGPANGLDEAAALELSRREFGRLLPEGLKTPQQLIWTACDGDEAIGRLWISLARTAPFIYDVAVREDQRGKGYGRAIMLAGEEAVRALGYDRLELNVFGVNKTAVHLYESLGYTVLSQQMRKEL